MIKHMTQKYICYSLLGIALAACGDDSSSSANDSETIANKTVSGVVQKGPFVKGSTVSVYELDSKFQQTKTHYESDIENDLGEFSVDVKKLESPYVLLKAEGRYRNEITGKTSKNEISLYALTDLGKRDEANINILTHLAYKRAIYLATKEKLSVAKAKKQAEKEVLESFGIDEDFGDAEDLNIFGNKDQNAALLAISILMLGDLSEADFEKRLTAYIDDIEKDGTWNKETATKIADWTFYEHSDSSFAEIRNNIKKWNISKDIPAFEKYVKNFWWQNYGLGTCTDKRKNETIKNKNSISKYAEKIFICRPDKWRTASEKEIEKYFKDDSTTKAKSEDGDIRQSKTAKSGCEVYDGSSWRAGSDNECGYYGNKLGGCTQKRENELQAEDCGFVICQNQKWSCLGSVPWPNWKEWDKIDIYTQFPILYTSDTLGWKDTADGTLRKGNTTDIIYIFDKNAWRVATLPEATLGKCTEENLDSAGYAEFRKGQNNIDPDGFYCVAYRHSAECDYQDLTSGHYKCSRKTRHNHEGFILDATYEWDAVDKYKCALDTYDKKDGKIILWKKGKEGELRWGNVCTERCYEYKNAKWNPVGTMPCLNLGECSEKNKGEIKEGYVVNIETVYQRGENGNIIGYNDEIESVDTTSTTWYVCRNSDEIDYYGYNPISGGYNWFWDFATKTDLNTSQLECSKDGKLVAGEIDSKTLYVCQENKYHAEVFREASEFEIQMGFGCTNYTIGKYGQPKDMKSYFKCDTICEGKCVIENFLFFWNFATEKNQGTMTDSRDSNVYKTMVYGNKIWMVENLNYADSVNQPSMSGQNSCENNQPDSCKNNGRLYTWEAAQKICPKGWHTPSDVEWLQLYDWQEQYVKSAFGFCYDCSGFLPAPLEDATTGTIIEYTDYLFWTSSTYDKTEAYAHSIKESHTVENKAMAKDTLLPVRCVKDD